MEVGQTACVTRLGRDAAPSCAVSWDRSTGFSATQADGLPHSHPRVCWRIVFVPQLSTGDKGPIRPLSCSPWKYLRSEVTFYCSRRKCDKGSPSQLTEAVRPGFGERCEPGPGKQSDPSNCWWPFSLNWFPWWFFLLKQRKEKMKLELNELFFFSSSGFSLGQICR